jgi:hypothetical protein
MLAERVRTVLRPPDTSALSAEDGQANASSGQVNIRRIILQAAGMWLATRLGFLMINYIGMVLGVVPAHPILPGFLAPYTQGNADWAKWLRGDGWWYVTIAAQGYGFQTLSTAGFFPFYPLLIHLVTPILGPNQQLIAALLISNVATLVGFIGLGLLAAHEERSEGAAWRLIKVVAAYPFAFFLFAPYTEGVFLAAVVFALYCARRGYWWRAATCAFVAGATRPTGAALILPLAWEFGRQHGLWEALRARAGRLRGMLNVRTLTMGAIVIAAVPLAVLCFMAYLKLTVGGAFLYFQSQSQIHHHVNWPIWTTLFTLIGRMLTPSNATGMDFYNLRLYMDGGIVLSFLVLTFFCIRRLPVMYTLYMASTLFLLLSSPAPRYIEVVTSPGRYLLLAIPVFMLFARWMERRPWLESLSINTGFMLQTFFVIYWLNGGFIE